MHRRICTQGGFHAFLIKSVSDLCCLYINYFGMKLCDLLLVAYVSKYSLLFEICVQMNCDIKP